MSICLSVYIYPSHCLFLGVCSIVFCVCLLVCLPLIKNPHTPHLLLNTTLPLPLSSLSSLPSPSHRSSLPLLYYYTSPSHLFPSSPRPSLPAKSPNPDDRYRTTCVSEITLHLTRVPHCYLTFLFLSSSGQNSFSFVTQLVYRGYEYTHLRVLTEEMWHGDEGNG